MSIDSLNALTLSYYIDSESILVDSACQALLLEKYSISQNRKFLFSEKKILASERFKFQTRK